MLFIRIDWTIAITAVVLSVAAPSIVAQSTTTKYQTWENPDQTASSSAGNQSLQVLLDELTTLVDEADRARAADPRFINDLRALIRGYDWPWRVTIVNEDFSDGRVAATPKWTILTGEFRAEQGVGLRSVVAARNTTQKQTSNDNDLASQLLNQLLKQATQNQGNQTASAPGSAQIHVATPISNAFAVDTTIGTAGTGGRFEIDIYQHQPGASGYRLAYNPGASPALELLRVGSRGASIIDAFHNAITVKAQTPITLQWTRDAQGAMVVSVDGTAVIRATDRGFRDRFDGLAFTNQGGDFWIPALKVAGVK